MGRYILGRILSLIFVLVAVSLITFLLMHAVPGGPFDKGERRLPEATRLVLEKKYGLNGPVWEQYLRYIWHVLHFDFGVPFQSPTETVTGLISRAWPVTIKIGIPTILLSYSVGIALGTISALRQNTWVDYFVTTGSTLGLTVPSFVIATWMVLIFSVHFKLLPTGGWGHPSNYVMPVFCYSLAPSALVARYTRVSLLEAMHADFVRTARAKGLSERRVMVRHVARNALIPFVTVLLPAIPDLLTGSVFIESVFRIPGLGRFFVTSTLTRDYPLVLALVLMIAALWSITYLITDLLYTVLDPRIRLTGGGRARMTAAKIAGADAASHGLSARATQLPRSNFALAANRFKRQKLAMGGLFVTVGLILVAILAPWISPTRYDVVDFTAVNQFPSWRFPFGTDTIGHNELSLIIYGIRTSLIVGFSAVGVACVIGLPLGLIAGLKGGWIDFVIGRLVDVMTAFPGILFAIFLMSVVNSGVMASFFSNQVFKVAFVIGVTSWVTLCRLMRAQVFSLRDREYITAARSCGASEFQIGVRHLLPNAIPPMIVAVTLAIPAAIFAEAGLSFLGVGVNDPLPSLGKMVADSRQYVQLYWHLGLFPAGAIALAVLGFAFVGDGLRDALDPRQN